MKASSVRAPQELARERAAEGKENHETLADPPMPAPVGPPPTDDESEHDTEAGGQS